jgi:hypothetical protein
MAEAAGVALGAVSLGIQVYQTLGSFSTDFKNADNELRQLKDCNEDFGRILERVKKIVDAQPRVSQDEKRVIDNMYNHVTVILGTIDDELYKFMVKGHTTPKNTHKLLLSAKWALNKSDVAKLVQRLDSVQGSFGVILAIVQLYDSTQQT